MAQTLLQQRNSYILYLPSGYLLSLNSLESVLLQPFSLCQVWFKQSVASQSCWDGRTHLSILTARNCGDAAGKTWDLDMLQKQGCSHGCVSVTGPTNSGEKITFPASVA